MRIATVEIEGLSPYSPSQYVPDARKPNESYEEYEERIWKKRCHWDESGRLFIPPMAFKKSLSAAAAYDSIKRKGKGPATFTKHFESGVLVMTGPTLDVTEDTIEGEWLFLDGNPGKGKSGGGTRVPKKEPLVRNWKATVKFHVLDDIIPEDVFATVVKRSGSFIGIGRFRPANGGFYGRFRVNSITWDEMTEEDFAAA